MRNERQQQNLASFLEELMENSEIFSEDSIMQRHAVVVLARHLDKKYTPAWIYQLPRGEAQNPIDWSENTILTGRAYWQKLRINPDALIGDKTHTKVDFIKRTFDDGLRLGISFLIDNMPPAQDTAIEKIDKAVAGWFKTIDKDLRSSTPRTLEHLAEVITQLDSPVNISGNGKKIAEIDKWTHNVLIYGYLLESEFQNPQSKFFADL